MKKTDFSPTSPLKKADVGIIKDKAGAPRGKPRLTQIVQSLSIAAFVIDRHHRITHCNQAFEKLTGLVADALVGTSNQWRAFYPAPRPTLADFVADQTPEKEIFERYQDKCRKSALIEGAYEAEDFFPGLAEGGKWLFFTASPLFDSQGRVNGAIETLQDVTDRKKSERALQKSERRLRALLDFEPYPVVVFTLDGLVTYVNPAFTEIFGWALEELEGRRIPYVPGHLKNETEQNIKKLLDDRVIQRYETQRLTKDGRLLDIVMRAAIFSISPNEPGGQIVILRDVTREKRMARTTEAILRISMALPLHPFLEELLDYVNSEVKHLLNAEGALTILHDEERQELFIPGAALDEAAVGRRFKESRFPLNKLITGKVIQTGQPIIINDTAKTGAERILHEERDRKLGYQTRNLVLVPLKTFDRIIGALCAINKKDGAFDQTDEELLSMVAGTVSLSIENARVTQELQQAYREVSSLNRAKDKAINHLSHELITPAAILSSSIRLLTQKLAGEKAEALKIDLERIKRNLDRVLEIQYELSDIISGRPRHTRQMFALLLDQCADLLESSAREFSGDEKLVDRLRERIETLYGPREAPSKEILLDQVVHERLEALRPLFLHRQVEINTRLEPEVTISLPPEVFQKVFDGLLRNAVENTPDEGCLEILVQKEDGGSLLAIHDFGQGIAAEDRKRIFEGFFPTREVMDYSTKRPYDFNAGGKGADLLRMKILSERYGFQIALSSKRCGHIPRGSDHCPGRISDCSFCRTPADCRASGETVVSVHFPPRPAPVPAEGSNPTAPAGLHSNQAE
ncbi:MAG: PAS domain S-box protein [Desulfobacterota bacterium]|nr:PAS domain S-box protein [Thermodesulfobacteriota bacterium]